MAIDVDWAGADPSNPYRIFIPRADMPLVQATPEVRELDADAFRLELKDLEASVDGMPFTDTHDHATERVLSGTTYGRFLEVLPPYLIEFEDGQYSVTVTGANTNVIDRKVANQVSVLGNNSAGLVNLDNILTLLQPMGTALTELHQQRGLDAANPADITDTTIKVPADGSIIDQTITNIQGGKRIERLP